MKSKIAKASWLFLFLFLPLIWLSSKLFAREEKVTAKIITKEWKDTFKLL